MQSYQKIVKRNQQVYAFLFSLIFIQNVQKSINSMEQNVPRYRSMYIIEIGKHQTRSARIPNRPTNTMAEKNIKQSDIKCYNSSMYAHEK